MAPKKQNDGSKSNLLILLLIVAVCLSIPLFYYLFSNQKPELNESNILNPDGSLRADYDPGVAWFQSKPILLPDGYGDFVTVRAVMRMKNRGAANDICLRHPHLADVILSILTTDKKLMEDALNGLTYAKGILHSTLKKRLGDDLFSETRLDDTDSAMIGPKDKVRYECGSDGLRLIFKDPPTGYNWD
ncbi:MAG: hypothetical protein R3261_10810 [Alphaproteobacteria bacterium]|nr:hypothetical protein [Alphaproteobacteria bacterium]